MRYNLELLGVCVFKKKEKMVVVVVVGTGKGREFEEMRLYEMNPSSYVKFFDFVGHAVQSGGGHVHCSTLQILGGTRARKIHRADAFTVVL